MHALLRSKIACGRKRSDEQAAPAFDTLEPARRLDVLKRLYRDLSGAEPSLPEPPPPPDELSRKERRAQELQLSIDWLEAESRTRASPLPGELERLGQHRGEAVQAALLDDTGMAAERVFLTRSGKVTAEASRVRFELEVK